MTLVAVKEQNLLALGLSFTATNYQKGKAKNNYGFFMVAQG